MMYSCGKRADGSFWLSIGDPLKGPHVQADWPFGEKYLHLFVAALVNGVVPANGTVSADKSTPEVKA